MGIYCGFIGYSGMKFDVDKANAFIKEAFDTLDQDDVIVSGATNLGIPKLVYKEAARRNMKTVGVMCEQGYDNELFPVDELVVVGENWGDESETFVSMLDKMFKIGGGKQSIKEAQMAREMDIEVVEYELEGYK